MTYHGRSLECRNGRSPMDDVEIQGMAKKAWQECGILTINPDTVQSWEDKQHLINIGNAMFGERREQ